MPNIIEKKWFFNWTMLVHDRGYEDINFGFSSLGLVYTTAKKPLEMLLKCGNFTMFLLIAWGSKKKKVDVMMSDQQRLI